MITKARWAPAEKKVKTMVYRGTVRGGVIVVPKEAALAEGAEVLIVAQTEVAAPLTNDRATAVWNALTELGRWAESQPSELPEDLARQHDHYLHGLPKRP